MSIRKAFLIWLWGTVVAMVVYAFYWTFFASNDVRVVVVNQSGQMIEMVSITPETNLGNPIKFTDLVDGETKKISFNGAGESAYKLTARFRDGSVLESEAYVENGYTASELILANKVETKIYLDRVIQAATIFALCFTAVLLLAVVFVLFLSTKFIYWVIKTPRKR